MRCPKCGSNSAPDAQFCPRCGTRLYEPRPADKREYALMRVHPAWGHFMGAFLFCCLLFAAGFALRFIYVSGWSVSLLLFAIGVAELISIALRRHFISWSLTSERLIGKKGILPRHR